MLHDLMQIIRGHLGSRGFLRHGLDRYHHAIACAAANTLEDAELAIAHYLEADSSGEPGLVYLRIYGVLQAAFLQLHGAKLLRNAFGLQSSEFPKPMDDLRVLRNRATAHPVDTPEKEHPATFIVRHETSSGSLKTLQIKADGTPQSSSVDLRVRLKAHSDALRGWMKELVDQLQRREKERREDIAARGPVSALMLPWWRYTIQKIHEASGASNEMSARLAQSGVSSLLEMLGAVEAGLRERDIDPPPPGAVETARAALDRLAELLPQAAAGNKVELDIAAFATLAERHLSDIAEFLKQVDERLKDSLDAAGRTGRESGDMIRYEDSLGCDHRSGGASRQLCYGASASPS